MKNISGDEVQETISGGALPLDVRTQQEFAAGHIKGAKNKPISPAFGREIAGLDKDREYLVYCRSGARSSAAIAIMEGLGFKKIIHLQHGILDYDGPLVR
jgi:phage shock protein E